MKIRQLFVLLLLVLVGGLCVLSVLFVQGSQITPLDQAQSIIDESGVRGGLIVHINCGDGNLTERLG